MAFAFLCTCTNIGPADYTSTTQAVTFSAGTVPGGFGSRQCINIPIIDDILVENPESFSVSASSTNGDVDFPNGNAAVVQIADNDSKSSNNITLAAHYTKSRN